MEEVPKPTSDRVYTSLPHSRNSLYKLDLQTMAIDTIWEKAPYVNQAAFSPDGKQLLVAGAGDAFDGIGQNIKQGQISNSYDGQLFLYDLASRKASPLTKDFNPNVIDAGWNRFNGQIYILCEDEDYQRIYTCDPANGKIKQVAASEDIIMSYALADNAPVLFYYGQSASNANRLYASDNLRYHDSRHPPARIPRSFLGSSRRRTSGYFPRWVRSYRRCREATGAGS